MSKLSDRDIRSITRQWKRGRPIRDLADYHHVSRQRIYQIIAAYRQTGLYPYPQAPGRKPAQIPDEIETVVLAAQEQYSLGLRRILRRRSKRSIGCIFPTIRSIGSCLSMDEWRSVIISLVFHLHPECPVRSHGSAPPSPPAPIPSSRDCGSGRPRGWVSRSCRRRRASSPPSAAPPSCTH